MKRGIVFLMVMAFALALHAQDWSKIKVTPLKPSAIELGNVKGTTGPIQTQLNGTLKVADGVPAANDFYTKSEIDNYNTKYLANEFELLKSLGANFRNMSVGASFKNGLSSTLVDGTLQLQLQYIRPYAYTIDTLTWVQGTQGNYVADNENRAGVYSYNLGTDTYTLVASIPNDGTLWTQSGGTVVVKALTAPYTTSPNEIIFTAVLYNYSSQTTGGALVGSNVIQSNYYSKEFLGTKYLISAQKATQTTLPTSFTAASRTNYCPMIIIK